MLSLASSHQYCQVQSAGLQHKELHSHPIKRAPGIPPCYTLIRFGRAGSLQRGPGKSGQTETAWASSPWKLGFRLLGDFRVVLPWDTGRNHQTEGFREGPRGGKSEQSPQGATFFPRVQCQFPWKPGKNPGCEETHWAGSAFGGGEKQEFSPLLFSHKLLDTRTSLCPPTSVSLSVHWGDQPFRLWGPQAVPRADLGFGAWRP